MTSSVTSITGASTLTEVGPLIFLTEAIVCSPEELAEASAPLLEGRSAPFSYAVPGVPRQTGGLTKPFSFVVAKKTVAHLLPAGASALFPGKFRQELHNMSAEQIVAFQAWSDAEKAAYSLLYSKEEWEANVAECRRVYKATNKAANKAKKRKGLTSEDCDSTSTPALASGSARPKLLLLCDESESGTQV